LCAYKCKLLSIYNMLKIIVTQCKFTVKTAFFSCEKCHICIVKTAQMDEKAAAAAAASYLSVGQVISIKFSIASCISLAAGVSTAL